MQLNLSGRNLWLVIGGSLVLILLFVFLVDVGALLNLLRAIDWKILFGAAAVLLVGYLLMAVRLRYIFLNEPGWWQTFYANNIGYLIHITLFGPAMIVRVVSLSWLTTIPLPQASSGILTERLLMEQVMRLSALALVIILLGSEQANPDVAIWGSIFILLVIFGALYWVTHHPEWLLEKVTPWLGGLRFLRRKQAQRTTLNLLAGFETAKSTYRLFVGLLISGIIWAVFFVFQYLVLVALPLNLPLNQMLIIAAAVLIVMPPSINVLLVFYHIVVIVLLTTLQLTDSTTAVVYAVTLHLIQMICWGLLGTWSLFRINFSLGQLMQAVRQYRE